MKLRRNFLNINGCNIYFENIVKNKLRNLLYCNLTWFKILMISFYVNERYHSNGF